MADEVRVGVIGTGFGGQVVAPAFAASEGCTVVDVVTPRDGAAVAALCAREDVDLISIHSPPFLHLDHVRRAIEAGHAVHCDKPFGLHAEESAEMVDLAQQTGTLNFLNFERRFDPGREQLRDLIAEGVIGTPNHFAYSRFIATPGRPYSWLCNRAQGGGWLAGQGSHLTAAGGCSVRSPTPSQCCASRSPSDPTRPARCTRATPTTGSSRRCAPSRASPR